MTTPPSRPRFRVTARVLIRSLLSAATICVLALLLALFRLHDFSRFRIRLILADYWPLIPAVFLGVIIWDYWFARAKRKDETKL